MSQTIRTTQGDRTVISADLSDYQPGIDLTGRDVTFVLRHEGGDKLVDAFAAIESTRGTVSYTLAPTDTALVGRHGFEWVVSGGSNDPTTYPVDAASTLVVREDVEGEDVTADPLADDATVNTLFAEELNGGVTGNLPVTTLAGANLSIASGVLDASLRTDEEIEDVVDALLLGGTNVTLTYDDAGDSLTIDATDTDTQRTNEEIEDVVGALVAGGSNITATYDDANNTLTIALASHGNEAHSAAFIPDGDGVARTVWVIANGAADPAGAGADDIIFEEQA